MDSLSEILDVKLMKRTIIYSIGLLILGAFVINHIEFSNSANKVGNYKESLWWSFNAILLEVLQIYIIQQLLVVWY